MNTFSRDLLQGMKEAAEFAEGKKGLPLPNAETVEAMKAARRGELVKAGKPEQLLRSLKV
jgi:hypothetical protein